MPRSFVILAFSRHWQRSKTTGIECATFAYAFLAAGCSLSPAALSALISKSGRIITKCCFLHSPVCGPRDKCTLLTPVIIASPNYYPFHSPHNPSKTGIRTKMYRLVPQDTVLHLYERWNLRQSRGLLVGAFRSSRTTVGPCTDLHLGNLENSEITARTI